VLGIVGLFFFLIGIVFFFVKETRQVRASLIEIRLRDGRLIAFSPFSANPAMLQAQLRR
jgi:hypothetical protein